MNNLYKNTQTSLLAYLSFIVGDYLTRFSGKLTAVNFDAHADVSTLPNGDLIGAEGLSLTSVSDTDALASGSVVFTFATESDSNNMRLTEYVSHLFDQMQPARGSLPFYDAETGDKLGVMLVYGTTQILPVDKDTESKAYQSIGIQFSVLANESL